MSLICHRSFQTFFPPGGITTLERFVRATGRSSHSHSFSHTILGFRSSLLTFFFFLLNNQVCSKHTQRARWMRPTPQPDLVSGSAESAATPSQSCKKKMGQKVSTARGLNPTLSHVISGTGVRRCSAFRVIKDGASKKGPEKSVTAGAHSATCVGTNRCILGCFHTDVV